MKLTHWMLGGMCVGQALIFLALACIYSRAGDMHERLGKVQLAVQELCDRIWDTIT
jgi:hypothetical protein